MSTSSKLVNNLSEIYSEKCRDKNTAFKGLKNKLFYNCKECRKKQLKPTNGLIKKFPNLCTFCNNDINRYNDILLSKKLFILNIWIVGKDLMKLLF